MSSTGTETVRSQFFRDGGATISTGARAGEELGHQLLGLHGGGEPDPLGGLGQQRVQPFQRHGQVRAALGAGDGVDLVDDDRCPPR